MRSGDAGTGRDDAGRQEIDYGVPVMDAVTGLRGRITGYAQFFEQRPPEALVEGLDKSGRPMREWVELSRLVAINDVEE